mgnify:CR=1 FL=1
MRRSFGQDLRQRYNLTGPMPWTLKANSQMRRFWCEIKSGHTARKNSCPGSWRLIDTRSPTQQFFPRWASLDSWALLSKVCVYTSLWTKQGTLNRLLKYLARDFILFFRLWMCWSIFSCLWPHCPRNWKSWQQLQVGIAWVWSNIHS